MVGAADQGEPGQARVPLPELVECLDRRVVAPLVGPESLPAVQGKGHAEAEGQDDDRDREYVPGSPLFGTRWAWVRHRGGVRREEVFSRVMQGRERAAGLPRTGGRLKPVDASVGNRFRPAVPLPKVLVGASGFVSSK